MDILFFLRCLETVAAVVGLNLSLGSLKKNARFTMVISIITLITVCGIISILYSNLGGEVIEKTYILIMIVGIGTTIIINTNDKLWVIIFNFFVQFLIYSGPFISYYYV